MNTIQFDKAKYNRLKKAYQQAVDSKQDQFIFKGHELLTSYAKYLIQYLKTKFG